MFTFSSITLFFSLISTHLLYMIKKKTFLLLFDKKNNNFMTKISFTLLFLEILKESWSRKKHFPIPASKMPPLNIQLFLILTFLMHQMIETTQISIPAFSPSIPSTCHVANNVPPLYQETSNQYFYISMEIDYVLTKKIETFNHQFSY